MDKTQIEIHSEEVQEIISEVPGWMSRWGITLMFVLFAVLLLLSWFIEYPDLIKAQVTITTSPAPYILPARTSGNITLLRRENEVLKAGDVIAMIGSNGNWQDVLTVERIAQEDNLEIRQLKHLSLGDLQPRFTALANAAHELELFETLDVYKKQIAQLNRHKISYDKLGLDLNDQYTLSKKEYVLALENLTRDSLLFSQGVLSAQDYNAAQRQFLLQARNHKAAETSVTSNNIQVQQIEKQIADLELQYLERKNVLSTTLDHSRRELLAGITRWKESYLILSPLNGTLSFLSFTESNMYVDQGTKLFAVVPQSNEIYAQALIPVQGSGKVKVGQEVNIRLENYPAEEFGMLRGKVSEISMLPTEHNYLVKIEIGKDLTTTHKQKLEFKQQLRGETEIITEDLRLIERLFNELRSLFK